MMMRFLVPFLMFTVVLAFASGCSRNQTWKKNGGGLADKNIKLPEPVLKDRTAVAPPSPIGPPATDVQPPRSETLTGAVPVMPGMPGGPSQSINMPLPPAIIADSPKTPGVIIPVGAEGGELLVAGEPADGPVRKAIDGIRDRRDERKEPPKLPSPFDPKEPPPAPPKLNTVKPSIPAPTSPMIGNVAATRQLLDAATKKYAGVADYECRLVRREVVNGKQLPTEELIYQFRKEPMSVYMRVTGEAGKGREVLYVKGQNAGKMSVVTGEGDNRLIGAGRKFDFEPDDKTVTAKSRNRIYDAGFGRPLGALTKLVESAEKGTRSADTVKNLGPVERKEYKTPPTAVEVTLLPGDDPLLPKGGKRTYYFDNDPKSDAIGLPVMIITHEPGNREVEYYCFDQYRMPAKLSDVDFSPERLGKRK